MKRHVALALASVAAVGAGTAHAQTLSSNVALYGRLTLGLDNYAASGANCATGTSCDLKGRNRIFDNGSRVGVRGTEDLGGGLRAVLQIESGVAVDNGSNTGQGGQANNSAGFFASRDSFVGLEGGFGRVTFGRQSVWWSNGTLIQHSANWINAQVPYWNGAQGRLSSGVTRQSNVLQYTSPTLSGMNATLSYSPDLGSGGGGNANGFVNTESQQAGAQTNGKLLGMTLRGAWGPIAAQYDYVQKETISGLTNSATSSELLNGVSVANVGAAAGAFGVRPKNIANKLLVGWTYAPGSQVTLIGTQLQAKDWNAITTDDLKQRAVGIVWEHTIGNVQLLGQYGRSGKVSGCSGFAAGTSGIRSQTVCDDSASSAYTAAVRYLFSKRTHAYVSYNRITNQKNQWADYTSASYTSGPLSSTNARGADPTVIAVGMIHNF